MCCIRLKLAASEVCGKCDPDQVDESAIYFCSVFIYIVTYSPVKFTEYFTPQIFVSSK